MTKYCSDEVWIYTLHTTMWINLGITSLVILGGFQKNLFQCTQELFWFSNYKKYSWRAGGCKLKYADVVEPWRYVNAFLRRAQTE